MKIIERQEGDVDRLRKLVGSERQALQRDRWRAVLMAIEGQEAEVIAAALRRARRSVQQWAYRYRDGGIEALRPRPRPGQPTKLPRQREQEFRQRLEAGPQPEDGVCTLRGLDVVRILEEEFGSKYTLPGAYSLLHRLGYSCLSPRPRHEHQDPGAQEKFRTLAPLLSRA